MNTRVQSGHLGKAATYNANVLRTKGRVTHLQDTAGKLELTLTFISAYFIYYFTTLVLAVFSGSTGRSAKAAVHEKRTAQIVRDNVNVIIMQRVTWQTGLATVLQDGLECRVKTRALLGKYKITRQSSNKTYFSLSTTTAVGT